MTVSSDGEVGVVGSEVVVCCSDGLEVSPFVGWCDDEHGRSSFVEVDDGCPMSKVIIDVTSGLLTDALVGVVGESSPD